MRWQEETIDNLPRIIVWVALFQLPFVLHEYFVLVPARVGLRGGIVAEDVVAGTLGASATGGGANAVLSILLVLAMAILMALYNRGLISPARLWCAAVLLLLPIFLNALVEIRLQFRRQLRLRRHRQCRAGNDPRLVPGRL